jgi:hypothetical protein
LQQRGYDFQVAQFLANIAMGTGALSGSTTTSTQPRGFFSNRGGFKTGESLHRAGKAYGGGLDPNSMGGAVYQPGAFERGGYATSGSVVDSTDLAAILAQQRQSFGPFAAAGPYGQAAGATPHGPGGIVPQQQMHTPKLVTAGPLPKQQAGAGSDLGKVYSLADEATKGLSGKGLTERAGEKMGIRDSAEKVAEAKGANMPGASANATTGNQNPSGGVMPSPLPRDPTATSGGEGLLDRLTGLFKSEGGGVMPRHRYADGGSEDSQADEAIPHDPSDVMSGKDPIEGVLKAGSQKHEMLKPAGGGGGGGGSGGGLGSDIAQGLAMAKTAASLFAMSDKRLKDNVRPVGKTFDGQNIYSYNLGDKPTQLGLIAQEVRSKNPDAVGHRGKYLTVNYDEATRHAANRGHFYEGGVVPRQHHADGERANSDLPIDAEIVERAPGLDPNVVSELKREEQRQATIPQEVKGLVASRPQEEPQIDYRGMVESAAKQKGLDVGHATRLVQGESGFKPIAGDEGSSGSLWQLHVGGLSEKYPNAGLGDDYFSQRRPELAKSFSPAQKIAYLNDPRNQQDITDFATDYIAKNGARPWTFARNQGLFGLSGQGVGAPRPPADVGRSTEAKTAEPGFFDRNKGIILPVLQGIGAMASSKSISPWAAALQGLGAGAKAYGDVEAQQAGIKQTEESTRTQEATTVANWITAAKSASFKDADGNAYVLTPKGKVRLEVYNQNPAYWGEPIAQPQMRAAAEKKLAAPSVEQDIYGEGAPSKEKLPGTTGPSDQVKSNVEPQHIATSTPKFVSGAPTPYTLVGNNALQNIEIDKTRALETNPQNRALSAQESASQFKVINEEARKASSVAAQFDKLAESAMQLPETGSMSQGAFLDLKSRWADYVNSILKTSNVGPDYWIAAKDVGTVQGMKKIQNALQLELGSKSIDALQTAVGAIPNANMSREGFIEAYAPERVRMQKAMDQARYVEDYRRAYDKKYGLTFNGGWSTANALRSFNDDNPQNQYDTDVARMKWLMSKKANENETYWSLYRSGKAPRHFSDRQTGGVGYRRYFEGYGQ